MYPYMRDESEEDEFYDIVNVARKLFSERISVREKAAQTLVKIGKKAVRPLVYVLECGVSSDMSDEELNDFADEIENILVKIGENALPDLEDFAANEECTLYVNQCAQEAIFKVMGVEGEDAQKVCKHMIVFFHEEGEKKVGHCMMCGAEFENEKDK